MDHESLQNLDGDPRSTIEHHHHGQKKKYTPTNQILASLFNQHYNPLPYFEFVLL